MEPIRFFMLSDKLWFCEILFGILALIGVNYLFKRFVKHVRYRSLSLSSHWKEKMDYIVYPPFHVLLWLLGATLVIQILGRRFDFSFFENYIDPFRSTGFIFCITWGGIRWKAVFSKALINREGTNGHIHTDLVHMAGKIISVVAIAISGMIVLRLWGLDMAPLIAFGGIGAAVIGFASKEILSNFFGGLMIHINRPFVEGDFIRLPSSQLEGYVEEIGWNLTTIRDKDKRPIYLPNATFSSASVINAARMTHRRIEEKLAIRYEDFNKISGLIEKIKQVITEHPDIDTHLPVLVVLNGFGSCGLEVYIDVYTLQTRYDQFLRVKHEILMLVYAQVEKIGAESSSAVELLQKLLNSARV